MSDDIAHADDSNESIWKSDRGIAHWVSTAEDRERRRADQRRLMAELLPFGEDDAFTFVDLGAGTGAASRAVLRRFPSAKGILAEYSPQMMEQGRRDLDDYADRFEYVEFDLADGAWPSGIPAEVDAVISSLCVHHLNDQRKQGLFEEVLGRLAVGGWFVNYDPVAAGDPVVEEAWLRAGDRQDPEAAAKRAHRTPEELRRWENHVRYIIPLAPQLGYLRSAGFEGVDVFWKELDHVIYGGRRPLSGGR